MVNDYKLHCPLSSRMLGQYYLQGKKKKEKKKKKWFEILHELFPSRRCTLRDYDFIIGNIFMRNPTLQ